jgi:hypothetical protein
LSGATSSILLAIMSASGRVTECRAPRGLDVGEWSSEAMHGYVGKCACGRLEVRLESGLAAEQFQPRSDAPTCAFCEQHDGVWISDPNGSLELRMADRTSVRSFGSGQVQFHFCTDCNELVYALFLDPSRDDAVAVVRVALFESIRVAAQPTLTTSFDGEDLAVGRQRRLAKWTPVRRR